MSDAGASPPHTPPAVADDDRAGHVLIARHASCSFAARPYSLPASDPPSMYPSQVVSPEDSRRLGGSLSPVRLHL